MVQMDVRTVKARVRNWERSGLLQYYQAIPNYRLFGIRSTSFMVEMADPSEKEAALGKIHLIDGVTSVLDFLGDKILVWLVYEDEDQLAKRHALLEEVTKSRKIQRFLDEPFGPVETQLSGLDWQILGAMRRGAMKPIGRIADELGVTRKTVRAHLEKLVASNAFFVRSIFDVTRVKGLIFFGIAVALESELREEAIKELDLVVTCSVNCFVKMVTRSGSVFLAMWAEDLEGVENSMLSARRIRGVKSVELMLYKRVTEYPQLVDGLIERKVSEAARARAPVPLPRRGRV